MAHLVGAVYVAPANVDFRFDRMVEPDGFVVPLVEGRWRPDDTRPEIIVGELTWQPDPTAPPLTIDLDTYFKEVCLE